MTMKIACTREIDGKSVNFYKLPMSMVFECNRLGTAVSSVISNLLADKSHDFETEETTVPTQLEGIEEVQHHWNRTSKPISPSLASMRVDQQTAGIKAAFDALTGPDAQRFVAQMVCRSAMDEAFDAETILDDLDVETTFEYLAGVQEANKGVFERLGKLLPLQGLEKAGDMLKEKMGAVMG